MLLQYDSITSALLYCYATPEWQSISIIPIPHKYNTANAREVAHRTSITIGVSPLDRTWGHDIENWLHFTTSIHALQHQAFCKGLQCSLGHNIDTLICIQKVTPVPWGQ